jgi:dolichol-phosphate mannosyltransferase
MASSGNDRQQTAGAKQGSAQYTQQEQPQTQAEPKPPYPDQKLEKPGIEAQMEQKPQWRAPRYRAAGKLEGKAALLASRAGSILARPLTGVRDPMSGFFSLRRSLFAGVALRPRGFKILLEILARTGTDRVVEVPIRFEDRASGDSKFDGTQRREFLRQVWTLYRDVNAWPWRLAKFLAVGALGVLPDVALLNLVVRVLHGTPAQGAVVGWFAAMTGNYALNRAWTFRARDLPLLPSYLRYALGVLGGLAVKLGVLQALPGWHYNLSNLLGILAGTLFNYLAGQLWAFAKR